MDKFLCRMVPQFLFLSCQCCNNRHLILDNWLIEYITHLTKFGFCSITEVIFFVFISLISLPDANGEIVGNLLGFHYLVNFSSSSNMCYSFVQDTADLPWTRSLFEFLIHYKVGFSTESALFSHSGRVEDSPPSCICPGETSSFSCPGTEVSKADLQLSFVVTGFQGN